MKTFVYELFPRSIARRKLALCVFSEMDRVDVKTNSTADLMPVLSNHCHTLHSPSPLSVLTSILWIQFLLFLLLILTSFLPFSSSFIRRVWRVLTLVAPSYRTADGQLLNPVTDIYASDYPFSVNPDVPLTPADLMRIQVWHVPVRQSNYHILYDDSSKSASTSAVSFEVDTFEGSKK